MTVAELIRHLEKFEQELPVQLTYEGMVFNCTSEAVYLIEESPSRPRLVLFDPDFGELVR